MFIITYLFSGFVFGWAKPIPVSPYYFRNRRVTHKSAQPDLLPTFVIAVIFIVILNWIKPDATGRIFELFFPHLPDQHSARPVQSDSHPALDGSRVVGAFFPAERMRNGWPSTVTAFWWCLRS